MKRRRRNPVSQSLFDAVMVIVDQWRETERVIRERLNAQYRAALNAMRPPPIRVPEFRDFGNILIVGYKHPWNYLENKAIAEYGLNGAKFFIPNKIFNQYFNRPEEEHNTIREPFYRRRAIDIDERFPFTWR